MFVRLSNNQYDNRQITTTLPRFQRFAHELRIFSRQDLDCRLLSPHSYLSRVTPNPVDFLVFLTAQEFSCLLLNHMCRRKYMESRLKLHLYALRNIPILTNEFSAMEEKLN